MGDGSEGADGGDSGGLGPDERDALARSERVYRDLFQNAPVGLLRVDRAGTVLEANRSFAATLGLEHVTDARGRSFAELLGGEGAWEALAGELIRVGRVQGREVTLERASGPVQALLDASARPCGDEVTAFDVTLLDLTAARSAREETVELRKQLLRLQHHGAIQSFAGGLVHDFNNLISIIDTSVDYAELVLGDLEEAPWRTELAECLADIRTASSNGAELAQQLLTMVREGGTERATIDLASVAERVMKLLRRAYRGQATFEGRFDPDLPRVRANASQVHQCVLNLCLNAIEAMPDGGTLRVRTLEADGHVEIQVEDDGHGMDDAILARIWDPYFTTKAGGETGGGTGLGLSMVRAIVRQHGGRVAVRSAPGEGTTVTLCFPISTGTPVEGIARSSLPRAIPRGNAHILLVHDDGPLGRRTARGLEKLGYRVTICEELSLAQAQAAADESVGLVILDLATPDAAGRGVLDALRQARPEAPVIVATDRERDAARIQEVAPEGVEVLVKPFSIEQLARLAHAALG